jgi:uncharacterized cupin superfamily protein
MPEAKMKEVSGGLTPDDDGWFIVNVADALWHHHAVGGSFTSFENREKHRFEHFGIGIHMLQPGEPNARYHSEQAQEAFMVLFGEALLIVEGEERPMKPWDFFHCPPGTHHIMVGAGNGPCAILMAGARNVPDITDYPLNELAAKYGAQAPEATTDPKEAYSDWPSEFTPGTIEWPPA